MLGYTCIKMDYVRVGIIAVLLRNVNVEYVITFSNRSLLIRNYLTQSITLGLSVCIAFCT